MNRGSRCVTGAVPPTAAGFNEAPIHESGKSDHDGGRDRAPRASMRPRFMNRGSMDEPRKTKAKAASLQ